MARRLLRDIDPMLADMSEIMDIGTAQDVVASLYRYCDRTATHAMDAREDDIYEAGVLARVQVERLRDSLEQLRNAFDA